MCQEKKVSQGVEGDPTLREAFTRGQRFWMCRTSRTSVDQGDLSYKIKALNVSIGRLRVKNPQCANNACPLPGLWDVCDQF
jgi:hypothetical protein